MYGGYPDPGLRDRATTAYYADKLHRLARIKAAYDPEGEFRFARCVPALA